MGRPEDRVINAAERALAGLHEFIAEVATSDKACSRIEVAFHCVDVIAETDCACIGIDGFIYRAIQLNM